MYTFTLNTLDTLPLTMPGAMPSRDRLRVWVLAAAATLSVQQACPQRERAPSAPIVWGTRAQPLSPLDTLAGHVNALLARLIPQGVGQRGRCVAIAWLALPSHGTVAAAPQDEVGRSQAKGGTTHFFTSATASAVVWGRRYPLALCRVRVKQTMEPVVRPLLAPLVTLGIRRQLLLLDRGFYRVRGLQDLLTAELPCSMPAGKRGTKPTPPGGPTGTYAPAAAKQSHGTTATLQRPQEGHVAFALAVVCDNTRGPLGCHLGWHAAPYALDARALSRAFWPCVVLAASASSAHPHQQP